MHVFLVRSDSQKYESLIIDVHSDKYLPVISADNVSRAIAKLNIQMNIKMINGDIK
jgi:hypothetical protein